MGQVVSAFYSWFNTEKEYKVLLIGLDNAGKTTTLYQLHLGQAIETQPTIGSNVETVKHKNVHFEVWDLGGQATLRPSWVTYYKATDALVMVVDSTDRARINSVKEELWRVIQSDDLKGAFVLVFANKQDLKDCMTAADISTSLKLHDIKDHDWHIQACSAKKGTGLKEGFDWMVQRVRQSQNK
ncbi:small ARF-related GTPase [Chloropicon primus]|uniref:Small ARF-related GTPase n=1 Tax=Chloropicon primus TaxID=1764295 RepID=A0A5B8MY43_9CHLO|nr:small ARF-related GTPase [Chloropicon primus]UPR03691.1 small ARF-related GTPase [Chloropicon primus]|mmetsp:Transcript_4347/g.12781  ORF Transcript_4347/g.12781 Transcript_4347/m.12781 type:complete len:184 (-) Transcript_4347:39-590(-)|eukprot:QDZ24482.1 small ARF-related GTPase [Chloropicon primus]